MTPIQLANMMAAVANRGYYYTPHIIKKIKGQEIDKKFRTKHVTTIDRKHFEPVIAGLFDVYNLGTAHGLNVEGIDICGKTGTAENYTKINGKRSLRLRPKTIQKLRLLCSSKTVIGENAGPARLQV
jgi:penicillin-binding protein 2